MTKLDNQITNLNLMYFNCASCSEPSQIATRASLAKTFNISPISYDTIGSLETKLQKKKNPENVLSFFPRSKVKKGKKTGHHQLFSL